MKKKSSLHDFILWDAFLEKKAENYTFSKFLWCAWKCIKLLLFNVLKKGKASSWDYVQKIKNNLKHIFTKFYQLMT